MQLCPAERYGAAVRQIPCVGAVIRDGAGRIVVVRRGRPPSAGLWSIPGGRVEGRETLADALRREVLEETRLEVEVGEVAGRIELAADDGGPSPAGVRYAVTDFYATPLDPASPLIAGDDALEARWVTRRDLERLPCSPGLVDTLAEWGVWPPASDSPA